MFEKLEDWLHSMITYTTIDNDKFSRPSDLSIEHVYKYSDYYNKQQELMLLHIFINSKLQNCALM